MIGRIVTVLIAAFACTLQAETLSGEAAAWRIHENGRRQQQMRMADYSPAQGKVLELTFVPAVHSYIELAAVKPPVLAETAARFNGTMTIELYSETAVALRKVSVRLVDGKGEIFQLMQPVQLRPGLWTALKFELSPRTRFGPVWGGNNDKKIDFPVSLWGLTFDFDKGFKGSGKIVLGRLDWTAK